MKVRIKTLKEFGGQLPAHWVDAMKYLLGQELDVLAVEETDGFCVNGRVAWHMHEEDFAEILEETLETNEAD